MYWNGWPSNRSLLLVMSAMANGLAKVSFSYGKNDLKLINHAVETMERILIAAGGKPEFVVPDTAHLMGGCRMGRNPETSVVNGYYQTMT